MSVAVLQEGRVCTPGAWWKGGWRATRAGAPSAAPTRKVTIHQSDLSHTHTPHVSCHPCHLLALLCHACCAAYTSLVCPFHSDPVSFMFVHPNFVLRSFHLFSPFSTFYVYIIQTLIVTLFPFTLASNFYLFIWTLFVITLFSNYFH